MLSLHHAFHRPISRELRAMDRFFGEPFAVTRRAEQKAWPRSKVLSNEDAISVLVEVPGLRADDIDISFHEGVLTLKSRPRTPNENAKDEGNKDERVLFNEQLESSFQRRFRFSEEVRADDIQAQLENGILRVTLPKKEAVKPRQIPIHVG